MNVLCSSSKILIQRGNTFWVLFRGPAYGVVPWRRPQAPVARARPLPRNVWKTQWCWMGVMEEIRKKPVNI